MTASPFEKLSPKLSELLFRKKRHPLLPKSSVGAFVHASTPSADVFQAAKVIDAQLQRGIKQNYPFKLNV